MRRIFELTSEQERNIQSLIEAGRYEGFHQFLSGAVDNQLLLELATSGDPLPSASDYQHGEVASDGTRANREPIDIGQLTTVRPLYDSELNGGDDQARWLWGQINSVLAISL